MPRLLFAGLILLGALPSAALVTCDSAEKARALAEERDAPRRALEEKRFAEADKYFNGILGAHESGSIPDAQADYVMNLFRVSRAQSEGMHEEWVARFPKSRAAHLAQGYYYMQRARAARGREFSNKTAGVQFAAMEAEFAKAARALAASERLAKKPTLEWALRLEMAIVNGDREEAHGIYQRTLKTYPDSVVVRAEYAWGNEPRWGGSFAGIARVASDARSLPAADKRYIEYLAAYHTGHDYELLKDQERALEYLERAMPLCPGRTDAAERLIHIYFKDPAKWDGLRRAATHYIDRFPDAGWGYAMRGWAYHQAPNKRLLYESFKDYERATQLGYKEAYNMLAWFYANGMGGAALNHRKAIDMWMAAHEAGVPGAKEMADKVRKATGLP